VKKQFLLLIIWPTIAFSQGLVGKWANDETPSLITEFRADGTWDFVDTKAPFSWRPYNSVARYSIASEQEISYLTFEFHYFEHSELTNCKYILERDNLIIFNKVLDHENMTTAKKIYKIIEVNYTRMIE